ncbi:protein translocase subunit secA [Caldicellulosiruptor bescii]|uniref:Protein translocase subunit SecA n=2 Tax=Caldicellulosiruptor bescii TaxID=31899 RepID=B9MLV7_CALBD|nr:preprotein translocase subunit SecA [Caldicellulosiruptor bescii]ACM61180.1 preprotein translocase, SecA subunit [Caldicellulosiruptor bescii DSM 6725]PBC89007.1 protein translocase subunit secA [Caldicellulosiruptor bescii]PBC91511.1 protein translocase subunit secA [Caldicellulosiruptor bescii]PBD03076.1 protein translocase subunit secA [Caldicellulosiruptor bescii]PBD07309.1 protein translocase subunit secA [Caldicellulosiruptor bescii]
MLKIIEKLIGSYSEREIKKILPIVDKIESLAPEYERLTDAELRQKTDIFKQRLKNGETLDDILPEAFAAVREAAWRTLKMRHFRVQLIGGIVLHQGRIAEMKTGEGKTLVATLPAYLNALEGKGVHIVTVNDYLAKRDAEWMGPIYNFLGLSVGVIVHGLSHEERKKAYNCDITYGTNNEFGFDYLRDNMAIYKEELVQRELNYAIIDEVDSILIDEARTPLIISGPAEKSTDLYKRADNFVRRLKPLYYNSDDDKQMPDTNGYDYIVNEKRHTVSLTEEGIKKAEKYFGVTNLADPENATLHHHIIQALKAHALMKRDRDYVVKDGQVIIVDEFTGRLMYGRRFSEGLHQAIEAKEGVRIERESKTLATITFQNYFRLYKKLAGMTGTAKTEEQEFREIYKLDVIEIPTHKPMIRIDHPDKVYKTEKAKFEAIVQEIVETHKKGQPVLVGTVSIEKSEMLSEMLKKHGIKHEVLNAKHHEKEAMIIAKAGQRGAVTIATNMAGRGTDIVLGEGVAELGGLKVIGTERHESRRIDNQLRGRAGRQGDPGESRFYVSLEDDLMRLFGSERIKNLVESLGLPDDQPIEHKLLSDAIEKAQKRVEARNFEIRKHLLQFDDVLNKQREIIYSQRRKVLEGENLRDSILGMIDELVDYKIKVYTGESPHPEDWDIKGLLQDLKFIFLDSELYEQDAKNMTKQELKEKLISIAKEKYEKKEQEIGELMRELERVVLLRVVDMHWMEHIDAVEQLREGISLRAIGQKDPIVEFRFEAFEMFDEMIKRIQEDTIKIILHANVENMPQRERVAKEMYENAPSDTPVRKPVVKTQKVGRNDPCPCGSGKKYKKCCGAV